MPEAEGEAPQMLDALCRIIGRTRAYAAVASAPNLLRSRRSAQEIDAVFGSLEHLLGAADAAALVQREPTTLNARRPRRRSTPRVPRQLDRRV